MILAKSLFKRFLKLSAVVNLFTVITGVVLIWFYLSGLRLGNENVSIILLFFGVFLCTISMVFSYIFSTKEKLAKFSLFSLYILSYCLLTIYSFRYYFFGSDLAGEYTIASIADTSNSWPISLLAVGWGPRAGRYASSLSVSVLPIILSKVIGIDLLQLFKFVMPAIGAFVPVVLYLLIAEVYRDRKLAFLGAMLFAISHLQVFMLSYMFRRQVGHLFSVLGLLVIFKAHNIKDATIWKALLALFFGGIVLSNYYIADWAFLLFLGILLAPIAAKILRRKMKQDGLILSWKMFLLYCGIAAGWLWFAANIIFMEHLSNLQKSISLVIQYGPQYLWKVVTTGKFLPSTPGGTTVQEGLTGSAILNIWYYFVVLLPGVGWLYALIRKKNNIKEIALLSWFFLAFPYFFYESFYGVIGSSAPFATGFLVFSVFTAISVHRSSWKKRSQKIFAIFSIMLIAVSLPLNLSLVNNQVLHFHPETEISPQVRAIQWDISFGDMKFVNWFQNFVPSEEAITVDDRGFNLLMVANHLNKEHQSYPRFMIRSIFLIATSSFVQHGVWHTYVWGFSTRNVSSSVMIANNSIVYCDGNTFLLMQFSSQQNSLS
ncbi:MAG: hypothetical protein OEW62_01930 [Candidatus Bathyarchaeota archaeon]|nr:hypothetical protein [Candidatus Bathyarchaeota archaeon]